MKRFAKIFAVGSAAVLAACGGQRGNGNTESPADSIGQDSVVTPTPIVLTPLPDTAFASAANVRYRVYIADETIDPVINSLADMYAYVNGTFTFRRNAFRNADFPTALQAEPSEIVVDWVYETDEDFSKTNHGTWGGGTGWTGQPLYVNWPDSVMKRFKASGIENAREEIIVGSLSGSVCFIDYLTGKPSRDRINTGNPIKGTVSLDPTYNGNLYVGQGVSAHRPVGALVIDLFKNKETHFFGADPKAGRRWEAYDSSPLRVGQFLIRPGENGTLYKFLVEPGNLKLQSALRYTADGIAPGMESSIAVYRNYGFTTDNRGNVLAVNLNTMRPVWHYKLPDDTDATPILAIENDQPMLYVGCEVEHAGVEYATFAKLNALTGEEIWTNRTRAQRADIGEKHFDGGFYATPLLGSGDCSNMIFANVVENTKDQNGSFTAIDRTTGKTIYSINLKRYAWSSPIGMLTPDGKQYIVTGDCIGNIYLIRGSDGEIIFRKMIGNNFESSPVAIGNSLVVGSRGKTIYKMTVK